MNAPDGFSTDRLLSSAYLSWRCYGKRPLHGWERHDLGDGLHVDTRSESGIQYFAVRGTDELRDWWRNFRTSRVSMWQGGRAHRGYMNAACRVLNRLKNDSLRHSFTGHSAGGGIALCCAYRCPDTLADCYTFGAPRSGDVGFADMVEDIGAPLIRVVNRNDFVPRTPFWPRFEHAGDCLYFDHRGTPHWNPSMWTLSKSRILGYRPGDSLREHDAANYYRNCERFVRENHA